MDAVKTLIDAARIQQRLSAENVNWYEALILLGLSRHGGQGRPTELADWAGLSKPTFSAATARIEKTGLVHRQLDEMDKRGVVVILTGAGQQRTRELEDLLSRIGEEME